MDRYDLDEHSLPVSHHATTKAMTAGKATIMFGLCYAFESLSRLVTAMCQPTPPSLVVALLRQDETGSMVDAASRLICILCQKTMIRLVVLARNQVAVSARPWSTEKGGCQSNPFLIFDESTWSDLSSRSTTTCLPTSCPIPPSIESGSGQRRIDNPRALPSRRINSGVERSSPSLTR